MCRALITIQEFTRRGLDRSVPVVCFFIEAVVDSHWYLSRPECQVLSRQEYVVFSDSTLTLCTLQIDELSFICIKRYEMLLPGVELRAQHR